MARPLAACWRRELGVSSGELGREKKAVYWSRPLWLSVVRFGGKARRRVEDIRPSAPMIRENSSGLPVSLRVAVVEVGVWEISLIVQP